MIYLSHRALRLSLLLKQAGIEIYRDAMTGEECAEKFEQLDQNNLDIWNMINRIQAVTGNDHYFTTMAQLSFLGVEPLNRFYREATQSDNLDYVFDNGNVQRTGFERLRK